MERLHYHGHLRIARREKGIRVYEPMLLPVEPMPPLERLRKLVVVVANLLAPIPERTLQAIASRLRRFIPGSADHRTAIRGLFRSGELEKAIVDKISYVWPPSRVVREEPTRRVSFLAPFDPLVWDRLRFEHFWQWPYRFEAYTPPAKRLRGYYAMPVLWGDRVIGWANAEVRETLLKRPARLRRETSKYLIMNSRGKWTRSLLGWRSFCAVGLRRRAGRDLPAAQCPSVCSN